MTPSRLKRRAMRRVVFALTVALASPVFATPEATPRPERTYRVVDVAVGDVLNIRRSPGIGSERVGFLPPDAADVVVTGERVEIGGSVWWRIITGDPGHDRTPGWVNARFLTPETEGPAANDFPLACTGTEPFWSLSAAGDVVRFSTPEGDTSWPVVDGRRIGATWLVDVSDGDRTGFLTAGPGIEACSDGMSDIYYPFHAEIITPHDRRLRGCCSRGGR